MAQWREHAGIHTRLPQTEHMRVHTDTDTDTFRHTQPRKQACTHPQQGEAGRHTQASLSPVKDLAVAPPYAVEAKNAHADSA